MINCIILDTGVRHKHKAFKGERLSGFSLKGNHEPEVQDDFEDLYGHGTAVFDIIREPDINITNIRLDGIENGMAETQLIHALQYIDGHCHADIVNLSLGITAGDAKDELYGICRKLYEKGVIIVSAFDNEGAMSYPAAFDCVIGVVTDSECSRKNEFVYYEDECINIGAKGNLQRLAWTEPEYVFMQGNSFACAHVTKQIIQLMKEGISTFEQILLALKKRAKKCCYLNGSQKGECVKKELPAGGRIALFPFNKEMHSLIRFSDMMPYKISKVYDCKYTGRVGSTTKAVLNDEVEEINIENICEIDMEAFDAFVFGHFEELEAFYEDGFRIKLIKRLMEKSKYIISFDELSDYEAFRSNDKVYFPVVREEHVPPNRFGKLFRINKPVIGVFGTSSQQGKFSLQLILRKKFMEAGYETGQIGTEPQAGMFGMDYVFPIGYNRSAHIDEWQTVLLLNSQLKELCDKGKEIILVGSQANTVVYDTGNLNRYTFIQNAFFQGTNPDAVVLVVNAYDEPEYVGRTISYLQSGENTKVIALVIFPMDIDEHWRGMNYKKHKLSYEEFLEKKQKFVSFGLPIFLLGNDEDMEQLFAELIDFFEE